MSAAAGRERGERGSIVSLLYDRGDRYEQTLFEPQWLAAHGIAPEPRRTELQRWLHSGPWTAPLTQAG